MLHLCRVVAPSGEGRVLEGVPEAGEPVAVRRRGLRAHQRLPLSLPRRRDYLVVGLPESLRTGHLLIREIPWRHSREPLLEVPLRENVLPVRPSHQPALRGVDLRRDAEGLRGEYSRLVSPRLPAADNLPDVHAAFRQFLQGRRHYGVDLVLAYVVRREGLHPVAGDVHLQRSGSLPVSHTGDYVRGYLLRVGASARERYLDDLPLGGLLREPFADRAEVGRERHREVGGLRVLPRPPGVAARGLGERDAFRLSRKLCPLDVASHHVAVEDVPYAFLLQRVPQLLPAELRERLRLRPAAHVSHYRDSVAPEVPYELVDLEVRVSDGEHRPLVQRPVESLVEGLRLRGGSVVIAGPCLRRPLPQVLLGYGDGLPEGLLLREVSHHKFHIGLHESLPVGDEPRVEALLHNLRQHLRRAVVSEEHPLVVEGGFEVLPAEAASDRVGVHPHPPLAVQPELAVGRLALVEDDPVALYAEVPGRGEPQVSLFGVVSRLPLLLVPYADGLLPERGELRPGLYPPVQRGEPLGIGEVRRRVELAVLHPEVHPVHLRPLGVDVGAVEDVPLGVPSRPEPLHHPLQPLPPHDDAVGVELQDGVLDVASLLGDGVDPRPAGKGEDGDECRLLSGVTSRGLRCHFIEPPEGLLRLFHPSPLLRGEHRPGPVGDSLGHPAVGDLRESAGEGRDKGAVAAEGDGPSHRLLPAPGVGQGEERRVEGVRVVRPAIAHNVGAVLLRVLLQLPPQ